MKISETHQRLVNRFDQYALTNPERYLGPNYKTVLNFWYYIDTLTTEQWRVVTHRYDNILKTDKAQALRDCRKATDDVIGESLAFNVFMISPDYAESATRELIAMHILLGQGKKLTFVPLFDGL